MAGKKKQEKESLATFRRITRYDQMIAAGTYPSVKKLIDEFETSEATVHRDLDALRYDFGADEYLKYDRFKGGYYYTSPTFRIPAQLTTEKQIISAQLMANLLDLIKGTPIYTQAIEVFTTLSSNIEQDTKLNAKKLSNRILFLGMNPVDIEDKTWSLLEEAMSSNHYISFDYEKNGNVYDVTMKPYQLIYFNGMWTLYGYRTNPGYEGNKFFNLPVIKNIRINNNTFELPEDFSYEKHAIGNFGRHIGEESFKFKLQILAPWIVDYVNGAAPEVLNHLLETNSKNLTGYGSDDYCEIAISKIKKACNKPDADVYFLTGGTQTNQIVISTVLKPFEGVIAANTGHVSGHEAGAIEFSGHKVLQISHKDGKLSNISIENLIKDFYNDRNHEHMVFPGMVYISLPTEYGTLYSKNELQNIYQICPIYFSLHYPVQM